ncbi:MAG TPA: hypothetical protein VKV28_03260 [Candidatus Binataceae bacterium]|nr:hypothetical protein [Candidatus Binataceae bacterium]
MTTTTRTLADQTLPFGGYPMMLASGLLLLAGLLAGCASGYGLNRPATMEPPAVDLTGTWTGTIRVIPCNTAYTANGGRCNAVNRIVFTLVQNDENLSGEYRCAVGTTICRNGNADTYGTVQSGWVSGNQLAISVLLPADLSNCRYSGASTTPNTARGRYSCYQGGALLEQGEWQLDRVAVEPSAAH